MSERKKENTTKTKGSDEHTSWLYSIWYGDGVAVLDMGVLHWEILRVYSNVDPLLV